MPPIIDVDRLCGVVSLPNLDLNLLIALDALLDQRGVTRAAQQLGLSQPALSASLARLRRHFGDELLAREAPRARLRLEHNTPDAVDSAEQTLLTRDLLVLPHGFVTELPHVDLV